MSQFLEGFSAILYLDSLEAVVKKATPRQLRVITAMSEEALRVLIQSMKNSPIKTFHAKNALILMGYAVGTYPSLSWILRESCQQGGAREREAFLAPPRILAGTISRSFHLTKA